MMVRWALTQKGIDAIPIPMMVVAFGSKYDAERVFAHKRPRKPHELFNHEGMDLVRGFL